MQKVAVITGGSGGIGRAAARALLVAGYVIYECSRRDVPQQDVHHRTLDLTDDIAVAEALRAIHAEAGRIDLVVNNAGFGISGATEYTDIADAKRLFDVNFFGAASVTRAAIPYLRETKGRVLNIGSVAGVIAIPFQSYYSASKAALASLSDALRGELRPFGISVSCLLPGDVSTGFTGARDKNTQGEDLYGGRIGRSVAGMERDEQKGMTPDHVAKIIAALAQKKRVAPQYTVGTSYKLFILLSRLLPRSLVNWLVGKLYAS